MPMNTRMRLLATCASAAVVAVGAVIYLNEGRSDTATIATAQAQVEQSNHDFATDGSTAIRPPISYRFNDSGPLNPADDYQELLARYDHDERMLIESFYAEYGGSATALGAPRFQHAFDFHNREQLAWLVANGYPTPDEILAADRMTDVELSNAAKSGSFKANVFYLARLQSQSIEPGDKQMTDVLRAGSNEMGVAMQVFRSGSPFGAIAYSRWADSDRHPELAAASLSFARKLGDTRREFLDGYMTSHPNIDPATLASAYELILALTRRSPSLRDMDAIARRPRFPADR